MINPARAVAKKKKKIVELYLITLVSLDKFAVKITNLIMQDI